MLWGWRSTSLAVALALALGLALPVQGATRDPKAAAADCAACHRGEKVLPAEHPATKGMKLETCMQCHKHGSPQALAGRLSGSHLHQLSSVRCAQCHGNVKKPTEVTLDKCMTCHDSTKVAETTRFVKPRNPHDSPHYGKDADCNMCHHQHAKSENYCAQCHKFEFRVP